MRTMILLMMLIGALNAKNLYHEYIKDLIIEKKYTEKDIKSVLANSTKIHTVTSNLLTALYLEYMENKPEEAIEYYEQIIYKLDDRIKNSTEAFYLAEYLKKTKNYDKMNKLFDEIYCKTLLDEEKERRCLDYIKER